MKIFILEDSVERINIFFTMFNGHNITVSNEAVTANAILDKVKFDIIFLDHDLGGQVYVDSEEENTGFQVAQHLPSTINNNTRVIIHSWNEPAACRMLYVLEHREKAFTGKVEQMMFSTFDKNILYN